MTTEPDRDEAVARALGDIAVPDHDPRFWDRLDERLRGHVAGEAASAADGGAGDDGAGEPTTVVVSLDEARARRRRVGARLLAAAAAVVVLAVGAVALLGDDGSQEVDVADDRGARQPEPPTTATVPPVPETTPPPPEGPAPTDPGEEPASVTPEGRPSPEEAVLDWVDALGAGDPARADALVGTRSRKWLAGLDAGTRSVMTSSEGYGTWARSPDRTTTEIELGEVEGREVTVVVLSGTVSQEGPPAPGVEAVPAVRLADGSWQAEPFAFGERPVLVVDPPGDVDAIVPDGSLTAEVGGGGDVYFSVDDGPVAQVAVQDGRAVWDPPGDLPIRTVLVVAVHVDGELVSAHARTLRVGG